MALQFVADSIDRLKNQPKLAAAAAAGAVAVGYFVYSSLPAKDGAAYMNAEQQALCREQIVSTSAGSIAVRRVLPSDATATCEVLASAASDDPLMAACAAENHTSDSRKSALRSLYASTIRYCLSSSSGAVCLQTTSGDAIAIWLPNGLELQVSSMAVSSALLSLANFAGWSRFGRLWLYSEAVVPRRRRLTAHRNGRYFYLLISGAASRPAAGSSSGAGAVAAPTVQASREAVILPVLHRADQTGTACYVEVTNPADMPFYSGLGFVTVDDFTVLDRPIAIMAREPRKGQ